MAVIKKSSSGRAIQFIDDSGNVFQLSYNLFKMVVEDKINGDFVVLTRMPIPVAIDRFPQSPVYGDSNIKSAVDNGGADAFSKDFTTERKSQKQQESIKDVKGNW